jgi:hypothetical protein
MPIIPLTGAACLVVISLAAFIVSALINKYRPKDSMDDKEVESLQSKIGFFAQNKKEPALLSLDNTSAMNSIL